MPLNFLSHIKNQTGMGSIFLVLIVVGLVAAGVGGFLYTQKTSNVSINQDSAPKMDLINIKIGNGPKTAPDSFLSYIVKKHEFDHQNGFNLDYSTDNDPGELQRRFLAGDFDITWGPTLTAAKYISVDQKDVRIIGPKIDSFMIYLSKANTNYKSFDQLKGKRFGVVSKVTASYQFTDLAMRSMDLSLEKDYKVVFADFPTLNKYLENGDIEFYPNTIDTALRLLATKKYNEVDTLENLWAKTHNGKSLPFITFYTTQTWMDAHPGVAPKVTKAMLDAAEYIRTNPNIWEQEKEYLKITTPEEMEAFKTRYAAIFNSIHWDTESIIQLKDLYQEAVDQKFLPPYNFDKVILPLK